MPQLHVCVIKLSKEQGRVKSKGKGYQGCKKVRKTVLKKKERFLVKCPDFYSFGFTLI